MTPRRRLVVGLVAVAAIILAGRVVAVLYSDFTWYRALGTTALWAERAWDATVIHVVSASLSGLFTLANLGAIRRSIISLAFPRRLGNVEFGEAVPRRYLDRAAYALSFGAAAVMALAVPRWESLALLRTAPRFGERDPFLHADLEFYIAWLPLEIQAYTWSLMLLVIVGALVVGLYALTPSLRWQKGAFHVSAHVRHHLAVLASLLLLTMAWKYRLDGYQLLVDGSGIDGMFSYVDHHWLVPAYLSLSIGTVAAAALVLASGWTGQLRAGFFTISAILIFSIALAIVLPSVARRLGSATDTAARDASYAATRAVYTRRAYDLTPNSPGAIPLEVTRLEALFDSARTARQARIAKDGALVYPAATGAALVQNGRTAAAPLLGSGLQRLAHGWAEQRLDLVWSSLPPDTRIAWRRDVRERVAALMPVFAQGSRVTPLYLGDSLVWVLELYSASDTYPLSNHYRLAGSRRSYFRHSGTALVNSITGRTVVVPSTTPDPIASAWRRRFPAIIRAGGPDLLAEFTVTPLLSIAPASGNDSTAVTGDAFRAHVVRLYRRMRAALAAGDLKAFGAAYDSLGAVVGRD